MCRPRPFLTSPLVVSSALMASSAVACAERAEAAVVEYREVFAFHDGNYDGRLTTAEFCAAVRSLGHAPTAMQVRLKRARPRVGRARRARGASLPLSLARSGVFAGKGPASLRASRQPLPPVTPAPSLPSPQLDALHATGARIYPDGACTDSLMLRRPRACVRLHPRHAHPPAPPCFTPPPAHKTRACRLGLCRFRQGAGDDCRAEDSARVGGGAGGERGAGGV